MLPEVILRLNAHIHEERAKREAFYNWVTEEMKAEFISGEIIVHSPVTDAHERASNNLNTLLHVYTTLHRLGRVTHEKVMISLSRNDFEPDICFFSPEKAATFHAEQKLYPAPDMVVEVLSKSTEKYDRGIKMQDYAAHGVREYWLVNTHKHTIEQYVLREGEFQLILEHSSALRIRSRVVDGFEIPVKALFNVEDFRLALAELQ